MSDADPSRGSGDSLWSVKPWWCQPWSIVLSGVVVVVFSWLWLGRWWLTAPLGVAVSLWWWLFLVVVPTAYARQSQGIS